MVTVDQLLTVRELDLAPLHLPDDARPLRWVATSELADPTPYLLGGELLLTTGLGTKRWTSRWHEYVARLQDAGVAALGLGVGLTHETAPPALVEACRAHGLNLLSVPQPTAFVAVSRTVAVLLDDEAEHAARAALDAQRLLTRAALRGDDDAPLLRTLGDLVDGAVAVVDSSGAAVSGPHDPGLDLETVATEVRRIRRDGMLAAASVSRPGSTTVVQPLGVGSRAEAWLAVTVPVPLGEAQRAAVGMAVSLLSLALERRRERRARDRLLRGRALDVLLRGDAATAALLLDSAGSDPSLSGRLQVLRVRGPEDALEDLLVTLEREPVLSVATDDGVRAGVGAGAGAGAGVGGEVVVVAPARRTAATIQRLTGDDIRIGVGSVEAAGDLARSHATAAHALDALPEARVASWDDLTGRGVLTLLGTGAAAYAEQFLAPIAGDRALLATVGAYLDRHASVAETALALGVHRNTVRNRIRQVEDALGRSFDDPGARVDTWVALQALR